MGRILWKRLVVGTILVLTLTSMDLSAGMSRSHARTSHHRSLRQPPTQGFYAGSAGYSSIELRGLRVPVIVRTAAHFRILELAAYWTELMGAHLRVVSAMDHIHARKSAHYAGRAIDFQGDHLDELARWFRAWGYKVYWRVPGHWQHVHVEEIVIR